MEIIIDLNKIRCESDFYTQLMSQEKEFGIYFGKNLDALWDYISLLGGNKIIFINYDFLIDELREFFFNIIDMIYSFNLKSIKSELTSEYLISVSII
ncbi:barstar family protein [Avibacterium avium]|uniref:barstar family protein n=1 Tax=Avibacterium avium TaxID=751 RepID=UPI0039FDCCF5